MPISTNYDQVEHWLDDTIAGINFHMPAVEGSLGQNLCNVIVEGIRERSIEEQCDGDGNPWPENSRDYAEWKFHHYGSDKINVRTSQMLSPRSLAGQQDIQDDVVTMQYGTGEYPDSSMTGYLDADDEAATDIEKATEAHAAGRRFYELDEHIIDHYCMPIVKESLGQHFRERAGA